MAERIRWQYEVVSLNEQVKSAPHGGNYTVPWNDLATVKQSLKQMGDEGWELVNAMPQADIHGCTRTVVLWFKRPLL